LNFWEWEEIIDGYNILIWKNYALSFINECRPLLVYVLDQDPIIKIINKSMTIENILNLIPTFKKKYTLVTMDPVTSCEKSYYLKISKDDIIYYFDEDGGKEKLNICSIYIYFI
jgi:hypothetical protein